MSTLRDIEATLPPGFRFFPSDEELVCHYLYKKIANEKVLDGTMVEVNLHICEPWQLPDVAKLGDNEWYFFSFRDRKYATGFRSNRTTTAGFWKATGKDRPICDSTTRAVVGMRKTLVFYFGRAPNGTKTGWIMHEFRLENTHRPPKEEWVLCRVFHKGKTEVGSKTSLENEYEDALGTSSPPVNEFISIGSQPNRSIPQCSASYRQGNDPSAVLHTETVNPNYLELFLKECEAPGNENCSKSGEEFLFDMMLEDDVMGNVAGASTFDEMRFEGDDHIDHMLFV